eukprot:5150528-Alexandrium_andersonii.AAC.1
MTSKPVVELASLMHSILPPEPRDSKESRVLHVDFAQGGPQQRLAAVSYTHLRAHETSAHL